MKNGKKKDSIIDVFLVLYSSKGNFTYLARMTL